MRIEIAGWGSERLRCPDVSVDLRRDDGQIPQVSLIQMPNGTGKTTTLELLNATLSGSAKDWDPGQVRQYRRGDDQTATKGSFKAKLLIDEKPLSLELVLDYETGKASYISTNPGSGGFVKTWHVPPQVRQFLQPQFLNLFIFDGEFAGRMLNKENTEADQVVDALCQIYLLGDAAMRATEYWKKESRAETTRTYRGLQKVVDRRDFLNERITKLTVELENSKQEIDELKLVCDELREKIQNRIDSVETVRHEHDEAKADGAKAQNDVVERREKLMSALRLPHAVHPDIANRLRDLRDNLDRVRLPENTSTQFFKELVEEAECICGRPLDEEAKEQIRTRAERYLDAADSGVINAIKQDISRYTGTSTDQEEDSGYERVVRLRGELTDAVLREREAGQRVRVLTNRLIDAGDSDLQIWELELEEKEGRIGELQAEVDEIEGLGRGDSNPDTSKCLRVIRREVEKLDNRIAQIKGLVNLHKQTQLVSSLLKTATQRARERIKEELLQECNDRLSAVLEGDPLVIDRIDRSIHLRGQRGASAGQTLAIGYTFLMSVLNRGRNDFPLVVDSPAGPIDRGVRRRIGRLLPSLCSQFVGFTINTEREGFVDTLESQVDDILYLTLFRKTSGTQRMMASLPNNRYVETSNAVLVEDRDYFFNFDIELEEEHAIQTS